MDQPGVLKSLQRTQHVEEHIRQVRVELIIAVEQFAVRHQAPGAQHGEALVAVGGLQHGVERRHRAEPAVRPRLEPLGDVPQPLQPLFGARAAQGEGHEALYGQTPGEVPLSEQAHGREGEHRIERRVLQEPAPTSDLLIRGGVQLDLSRASPGQLRHEGELDLRALVLAAQRPARKLQRQLELVVTGASCASVKLVLLLERRHGWR
mmetsp:Transcript_99383/g.278292  ORF Transcript_99383/g.278292 Transcript_99383/m.278292 type:complete len:207 (+) Transcript_99383:807-1427(+)